MCGSASHQLVIWSYVCMCQPGTGGNVDGRRLRGERTRQAVAARAAAVASIHGLEGMTLARLAEELGVSKSSIQAAYGTKEEIQLAAVSAATQTFVGEVITPSLEETEGLPRLLALVDAW